ncbi:MAG: efflux RND transporter permease subunit [Pseudomonadota bacterium]
MKSILGWFLRNPVAANLLMVFIIVSGLITLFSIRIEGFPRMPPDSVQITTTFLGASTAQVDDLVTRKIEKAIEGLEGVKSVSSQSAAEVSYVEVRKVGGADLQELLDRVRMRIDAIDDFPASMRRPVIESNGYDYPALYINIHGDTDPLTLQALTERFREDLLAEPELSRLEVWGLHARQMRIEFDPKILRQFQLTIDDVVEKIRASSLDFQTGTLRTIGGNVALKTDDRARFSTQFADIPLIEDADGTSIALGQIAKVSDTFEEGDYLFRFNSAPTTGMAVLVGQKESVLRISEVVHAVARDFEPHLPPGVEISVWGDASTYITDRLGLLSTNGVQGLLLVILVLALFLDLRLAFWVAMGIPISIMGALAVAGSQWVDYSLNDVTTFGLIIALGLLVDDAVVVGESVFEHRQQTSDPIAGTQTGVEKVALATIFGGLTTIAAFYPLLLLDSPLGKVLASFSGIVILALAFSLIESKLILPAHLASLHLGRRPSNRLTLGWSKLQAAARSGLDWSKNVAYRPLLKAAIHHRYAVLIIFVSAGLYGLGLIGLGKIKTVFFPDVPGQIISISVEMDARAPFQLTRTNVERLQSIGEDLNQELRDQASLVAPPIRTMFLIISSATSAQLYAELTPVSERRNLQTLEVLREWRRRAGQLEGATALQFTATEDFGGGFLLRLVSRDTDELAEASKYLKEFLAEVEGAHNIRDTLTAGQPQLAIRVKPEARSLGFDPQTLASQIGNAFGGAEVDRVRRDGRELRVLVQNTSSARNSFDDLLDSRLRSKTGAWIPLRSVAEIESGYVPGTVHRENGKLVNTIAVSVDRSILSPEDLAWVVDNYFVPEMPAYFPNVKLEKAGEIEEIGEIQEGMKRALLLAAVTIFVLMAIPLKSYWQPVLILAIIPFGFVGAAIGHLIMGIELSVLSFFGMLALSGVVINDSLVLVTRYNQAVEAGLPVNDALIEAATGRYRAIFLTTATTVIGLAPLLTETSEQAQYLIPAATSLAFGELFATLLMLILVPVLLAITEDVKRVFRLAQAERSRDAAG